MFEKPIKPIQSSRGPLAEEFSRTTTIPHAEYLGLTGEQLQWHKKENKNAARKALAIAFSDVAPAIRESIINRAMEELERARCGDAAS
jgi:hypothetical protein